MRGVPVLRVRGVPIEAHWSVLFLLVAATRAFGFNLSLYHPDLSSESIAVMAVGSSFLLVLSIVLHELGHSLQARREGFNAERITLWGLGGVAWSSGSPRSPGADYRVVAAGPLVTFFLAGLFGALAWVAANAGLADTVVAVLAFQAAANAVLLVFNLLPIYPLDGGQLLHSALWRLRGHSSGAVLTTRIGTALAALILCVGVVGPFVGLLAAPFSEGLNSSSFMITGFGLLVATRWIQPPSRVVSVSLRARQVGDLLQPEPVVLSPETTTAEFIRGLPRARGYAAGVYPVVEDGHVVGVVSPGLALDAVEGGNGSQSIEATMVHKDEAVHLSPSMPIEEGFAALDGKQATGIVLHDGQILGILRRSDLAGALLEARESPNGSVAPVAPPAPMQLNW